MVCAVLRSLINYARRQVLGTKLSPPRPARAPYSPPWPYNDLPIVDDQVEIETSLFDPDSRSR